MWEGIRRSEPLTSFPHLEYVLYILQLRTAHHSMLFMLRTVGTMVLHWVWRYTGIYACRSKMMTSFTIFHVSEVDSSSHTLNLQTFSHYSLFTNGNLYAFFVNLYLSTFWSFLVWSVALWHDNWHIVHLERSYSESGEFLLPFTDLKYHSAYRHTISW